MSTNPNNFYSSLVILSSLAQVPKMSTVKIEGGAEQLATLENAENVLWDGY